MAKYKKKIIWGVIIAAIIGGGYYFLKPKPAVTVYTTADAAKGNLAQTVSETGTLNANETINLNFETGGRIRQIFVKKGDRVAAGDKIAMIDDVSLNDQLRQARAALDKAIADAGTNNDALREAKVAVDNADDYLNKTEDLNDRNIDAAKQAVTNGQNYYDDALDFYNDTPTKANKLTLTSAKNSLEAAKKAQKVAQDQADLAEQSAENSLDAAQAKLKTVQSDYAERSRDAVVANAQAGYDLALNNLSKSILKAPANGIITEVNNKVGEVLGATTLSSSGQLGAPVAKLMSFDNIIDVNVPESDIVKIKNGQKANITFDALTPQDIFDAEVAEVDPAATVIQDVVYYAIKLRIASTDPRLKPGMTANSNIHTAEAENVLIIPLRAVQTEGTQKYVQVLTDAKNNVVERKNITTGLEGDEGMVEVKSGLNAGDKVVTFTKTQ